MKKPAAELFVLATLLISLAAGGAPVPIETIEVADGIYMLLGRGGNVGVSIGADGVLVIDDQYAEQAEPINAAIAVLTQDPVKFLLNTHWHSDHTGGNEAMARGGAVIIAHENVRERLSTDQVIEFFGAKRAAPAHAARPVITFEDGLKFHMNGDQVEVYHVENAHTDGDAIVHFRQANVIHTGDVFFNERYPFIDAGSGGSVSGVIAAVDRVLAMADDHTRIIPGHGPLTDKQGLSAYRDMLNQVRMAISQRVIAGETEEKIVAARPTATFDAKWGNGFLKPDAFVRMLYDSLRRETLQ